MPVRKKETAPERRNRMGTPAFLSVLVFIGLVIVVGAVFLGKSDSGEIDVSAAIQNSNQANLDANGDPSKNVGAVSNALRDMPNGGLVPQEQGASTPPPAPETPTDGASTTPESTATTTDAEGSTSVEGESSEETASGDTEAETTTETTDGANAGVSKENLDNSGQ